MERKKPDTTRVKIELRPMNVGINYAMEELRREYAQIQGVYEAAIREINARLQTLDSEFSFRHLHNPIHHMESRVKSLSSIVPFMPYGWNRSPALAVLRVRGNVTFSASSVAMSGWREGVKAGSAVKVESRRVC